jgi:iron complex transport system ATP-binding protein
MTAIVEARTISVRLGRRTIVDGLSLAIAPGETVALVGPNGAGKTTLLRVLSGDLRPRAGGAYLKGRALASYTPRELAEHRAVLSQGIGIAFPFTVAEIVHMGAGDRAGRRVEHLIESALAEVDLDGFHDRIVTTLSGGEQQRAHFARVLVQLACGEAAHGPGVLLLDEPTSSLDLKHQIDLLTLARRRADRGFTVIAILHDLNLATLFGDRIVVLKDGRIDRDGPPAATVTTDMVERVFDIGIAVGRPPPAGVPYILPQALAPSLRNAAGGGAKN